VLIAGQAQQRYGSGEGPGLFPALEVRLGTPHSFGQPARSRRDGCFLRRDHQQGAHQKISQVC
jgi:hypothetical protein